jgi:hypothetical protein
MSAKSRTAIATLLGSLVAATALQAQAGGILVVNSSSLQVIHPYFRSNCWNPALFTAKPGDWVFFGGIGPRSQFGWDDFDRFIDPRCKHPIVRYTYVLDNEAPPTGHGLRERTTTLFFDLTVPRYVLEVTDVPELTSVTPARESDRDGDDD